MRTEDEVLEQFDEWARDDERVRAAILTGSRTTPRVQTDFLSDYDIALYVVDLKPFQETDDWLNRFGSILVRWPLTPRSTFDSKWLTRLVLFEDGVRIDFQITKEQQIDPNAYDNGYRVLLDKDRLTTRLGKPTYTLFNIKRPSKTEFETLVTEFWWDATYVPKHLARNALPFAKYMLDYELRYSYLHRVLEWYIAFQHNWAVNTGCHGKWFERYLSEEIWSEYQSTYAASRIDDNWDAFFRLVALFRHLARETADHLGYDYPTDVDKRTTEYLTKIHKIKSTGSINRITNSTQ